MSKIDPKEIQKRMDRITYMFENMVTHADKVSRDRCPYRNRTDHCTATFRCRNQKFSKDPSDDSILCLHDGTFNYSNAWENNPLAYKKVKAKVRNIRSEGKKRRAKIAREHES